MTTTFEDFVMANGLLARDPYDRPGTWHRCPTEDKPKSKNGAYLLVEPGGFGFVQNWRVDPDPILWRAEGDSARPQWGWTQKPMDNMEAMRLKMEARRKASRLARDYYRSARILNGPHEYTRDKGLKLAGCQDLRVGETGDLVVPMWTYRKIASVQRIFPDGRKRFWPGAPTKGASFVVGPRQSSLTILCEGLATGLTIHHAIPHAKVVVCFSAANLSVVAQGIRRIGMFVVAADNDAETEARTGKNPGFDKGAEAAKILRCGVAVPEGIQSHGGTDWDDFRAIMLRDGSGDEAVDWYIRQKIIGSALGRGKN